MGRTTRENIKDSLLSIAIVGASILVAGGLLLLAIEPKGKDHKGTDGVDWDKVVDEPSRTLDISWQGIPLYSAAMEGSWIQRNIEKKFNVRIHPVFLDWNSYGRRRPLTLAGGEVPDVLWDGDPVGVRNNVRNKFILELPYEVILKYAPNYVKELNSCGKEAWLYSYCDGRNYGLPTFNEGSVSPPIGIWRLDWLRKVGIDKVPDTPEEMEEAFRRFRHNDPDGNGIMDTYGCSPNISHWSMPYAEIFAANNLLPFDFIKKDGKIVWGGIQPEAKNILKTLREWYADGLIDPDYIMNAQGDAIQTKFLNGKIGYMYPCGKWADFNPEDPNSRFCKIKKLNPNAELAASAPLRKDANSPRLGRSWGGAEHIIQFGKQLEKSPEKVIRVLKILDRITTDEKLYIESKCGAEGIHWTLEPGKGIRLLEPYASDKIRRDREMLGPGGFSCSFFYRSSLDWKYHEKYTREEVIDFNNSFARKEWIIMNELGKSDVLPSASIYMNGLWEYQQVIYAKIITGKLPLDYFETFVQDWNKRGGEVLTREANDMSRTIRDIYGKVGALAEEKQ